MKSFELPLFSVDSVLFTVVEQQLKVLLVKRAVAPYEGLWSLPGGYVDIALDKDTDATAKRKLEQKAGVVPAYLEQLKTYSGSERDPRGYSVTLVYYALIGFQAASHHIASVEDAKWIDVAALNDLSMAFDHRHIVVDAHERLKQKALYSMLPVYCLPERFTVGALKGVIEAIIGKEIQRKSLMRRIENADMLEETDEYVATGRRRAKLYRVKSGVDITHFERNLSA
ncbi:NUDIX hydrolase [Thaumasiovibrio subtropicus]|uniref:NUDIX hydrolase n=1 Tax=Thaumasiovibrio subtropicus TaxID=1891207 RepID=UPI001FE77E3F|nr:NUDIX domain-containing protein [Thaumasiovibrio subtropicus]